MDGLIKLILTFSVMIFIASCTRNTNSPVGTQYSIAADTAISAIPASLEVEENPTTKTSATAIDSSVYVGTINAFDSTREYYISIYSLPHRNDEDLFEVLADKADSVVFTDIETRRSRIPMEIAKKYFNLIGLEKISVYDNGQHLTDARLVRVEEYSGPIESYFIAVYKPDTFLPLNFNTSYCVSSGRNHSRSELPFASEAFSDTTFTRALSNTFQFDSVKYWSDHVKVMPAGMIYSGITLPRAAFLIETAGDVSTIVKQINESYVFVEIIPVHIRVNGKFVLLLYMGVPDSDMVWTSLAVFSGTEYQLLEGNRLGGRAQL